MRTEGLFIIDHPVAQVNLTILRDKTTGRDAFNAAADVVTDYLIDAATKDLRLRKTPIITPMEPTTGKELDERVAAVIIYRAALTMLPAFQRKFRNAQVGFIDIARDEITAKPMVGRVRLPEGIKGATTLMFDPMLATGGSMREAIREVKIMHPGRVKVLSIIAAPEGVDELQKHFPDINIYLAALDRGLNEVAYILPGLGDAGDRSFGTGNEVKSFP